MSDLTTTVQDSFRDVCIDAYIGMRSAALGAGETMARRWREDRGQVTTEYMGVILVISVIIAAVATTDIGNALKNAILNLIAKIAGDAGTDAPKKT